MDYHTFMEQTLPSTIPSNIQLVPQSTIDSLSAMFAISMVASIIIFAIVGLFYIISAIRKWKVESAILDMHKDLKEIKAALGAKPTATAADPALTAPRDPAVSPDHTL